MPVASALIQAACVLAISSHLRVSDPTSRAPAARTGIGVTAPLRGGAFSAQPAAGSPVQTTTTTKTGARQRDHVFTVSMDRNRMQMQAHLLDPLNGQTEGVWVEVSRGSSKSSKPSASVTSLVHTLTGRSPR
jgi:hypothetical protein